MSYSDYDYNNNGQLVNKVDSLKNVSTTVQVKSEV